MKACVGESVYANSQRRCTTLRRYLRSSNTGIVEFRKLDTISDETEEALFLVLLEIWPGRTLNIDPNQQSIKSMWQGT
jgi:hypothetical protein